MNSSWHAATRQLGATALIALLTGCGGGGGGDSSGNTPPTSASPAPSATVPPSASTTGTTANTGNVAAPPDSASATPAPIISNPASPLATSWFASMPAPASAPTGVFISEVANNYEINSVSWVEIYNNSGTSIDLSSYSLRTPAINLSTAAQSDSVTFALPPLIVPANAYAVVGARVTSDLQNTPNNAYLANAQSQVPYWQGDAGFVELLSSGATVDFVAFGSSTAKPTTANRWSGVNVPAMASTNNSYNTAIVRPFAQFRQTQSASDWTLVNFATPGGINDVAAGVTDSDGDGIPDSAKVSGGSYAGQDLYAMGARKGQRDLFIHVDYIDSRDPGIQPSAPALNKIVQTFKKQNIAVHFDVGNLFTAAQDGSQYNLSGNVSHQRPASTCTQLLVPSQLLPGCGSLYAVKSASLDIRRKPVFRYLLMAHSQQASGNAGASGSAEMLGDDFLVTLGGWGLKAGSVQLMNYQAATIMHELGHTLGLRHGGDEDAPNKPNYYSVMNYLYQMTGLPNVTGMGISQRYYYWLTNYQNQSANGYSPSNPFPESLLDDGPQSLIFKIDYSDGTGAALDENALQEAQLIGRGTAAGYFADWSGDGSQNSSPFSKDLNASGSRSVLKDYNDWGHLVLNSRRYANANNSGVAMPRSLQTGAFHAFDAVTNPFQRTVSEDHPPSALLQRLRSAP